MKDNSSQDSDRMLDQAIRDYLLWMIDTGYAAKTWSFYERILILKFSKNNSRQK